MFNRKLTAVPLLALAMFCSQWLSALGQEAKDSQAQLVTKVYSVADLAFTPPNYPYRGLNEPEPQSMAEWATDAAVTGAGGNNFFGDRELKAKQVFEQQVSQLIDVIRSVEAASWDKVGGAGTIVQFGGRLIISQTPEVHTKIEKFLSALRDQGGSHPVTVRAWWLRLTNAEYTALLEGAQNTSPPQIDRDQFLPLLDAGGIDRGEITCFDGQTVHIISGRFRNVVGSVSPVVGQRDNGPQLPEAAGALVALDTPAAKQVLAEALQEQQTHKSSTPDNIQKQQDRPTELAQVIQRSTAYQPVINKIHSGAILELTPTRLQAEKAVILDLRSIVNQWSEQPEKGIEFNDVVALDRTTTISQRLATTLKAPLNTLVLVGGLSLEPGAAEAKDKPQLYLVVEAIDDSARAPHPAPPKPKD